MLDRTSKRSGIPATLSGTGNGASIHWSGPARNHVVQSVRVVEAQLGNQFQASVNYSRFQCRLFTGTLSGEIGTPDANRRNRGLEWNADRAAAFSLVCNMQSGIPIRGACCWDIWTELR
jgi:hypothetical protein